MNDPNMWQQGIQSAWEPVMSLKECMKQRISELENILAKTESYQKELVALKAAYKLMP